MTEEKHVPIGASAPNTGTTDLEAHRVTPEFVANTLARIMKLGRQISAADSAQDKKYQELFLLVMSTYKVVDFETQIRPALKAIPLKEARLSEMATVLKFAKPEWLDDYLNNRLGRKVLVNRARDIKADKQPDSRRRQKTIVQLRTAVAKAVALGMNIEEIAFEFKGCSYQLIAKLPKAA